MEREEREEVVLRDACACGAPRESAFVHVLRGGAVSVHLSSRCGTCCVRQEGELPALPPDAREALLIEHGLWGLFIRDGETTRARLVLRKTLGLDLRDAVRPRDVASPVSTGTRVEVLAVCSALSREGIAAEVRIVKGPPTP